MTKPTHDRSSRQARPVVRRLTSLAMLLVVAGMGLLWYACSAAPPANLGVHEGRLSPCPDSPNCVSSFGEGEQRVDPLVFEGPPDAAMERLVKTISGMDEASIITQSSTYLHAEFRTPLLGFVDDVEFVLDPDGSVIHVRSASRRGYSDLGTNRARIGAIRDEFAPGE